MTRLQLERPKRITKYFPCHTRQEFSRCSLRARIRKTKNSGFFVSTGRMHNNGSCTAVDDLIIYYRSWDNRNMRTAISSGQRSGSDVNAFACRSSDYVRNAAVHTRRRHNRSKTCTAAARTIIVPWSVLRKRSRTVRKYLRTSSGTGWASEGTTARTACRGEQPHAYLSTRRPSTGRRPFAILSRHAQCHHRRSVQYLISIHVVA
jgi:hypothetical protein